MNMVTFIVNNNVGFGGISQTFRVKVLSCFNYTRYTSDISQVYLKRILCHTHWRRLLLGKSSF